MTTINQPNAETQQNQFIDQKSEVKKLRPWRRYFARHVDLFIGIFLGVISLQFYLSFFAWIMPTGVIKIIQKFPEIHHILITNIYWVTIFFLLISIVCTSILINAIQITLMGTTIGKYLFGISLKDKNGHNLNFFLALHREFIVFLRGLALGLPVFDLFPQFLAYRELIETGKTSWDTKFNCTVSHNNDYDLKATTLRIIGYTFYFLPPFVINHLLS